MYRIAQWFLASLCLLVIAGCGVGTTQEFVWKDLATDLSWPTPPDQPRIRFLRTITGPHDFDQGDGDGGGLWRWLLGDDENVLQLMSPYAVATTPDGIVWVADSGSRMLYRIDLTRRKVDYISELDGQRLTFPSGIAVDMERQRLFFADSAATHVYVLDLQGKLVDKWAPEGGFKRPAGLALSASGELLVCDVVRGTVLVFDADGHPVSEIKSKLSPDGRFASPIGVAVGPAGEVVILDTMSFRLEIQDSQGGLIGSVGRIGDAPGSFARPKGVAVDDSGHIFVSDAAFDNIQVFDMAGNLLMYFGEVGNSPGQFNLPGGLHVDNQGRLFVADTYNHRLQVFQVLK